MLFAAGVGIDLLFFSVTGPVVQYLSPPSGEPASAAALQDAVVWTMFHYGIAGWAVYALLGMAMGYFAYRWNLPLSIRAALYPLFGKRVKGPLGDAISTIALIGTVFGVATTMGIGVVLLNVGFAKLFGFNEGLTLQIALVVGAVILTSQPLKTIQFADCQLIICDNTCLCLPVCVFLWSKPCIF